ncbi:sugar phosphate isomerase/epimerase family protein [Fimbriiglobus ruber]|uniref:Sugar phosphate isomerase n=1 Tax=Fimbriiglobus ruber TaxID=1908690 RepID=A0A225E619_9BACT|nr:sugar phosphate isomerase/epimerase family protein [Fimbriiglobus ruber]OWK47214.1 sugar phosphate isomerase [Fimbriiglobus ruber]
MKSAVTISLVPEAKGGPFVYWGDLAGSSRAAAELGFDAVEVFPPGPDAAELGELKSILADNKLSLAAVGTGAGWVKHKLTLTHPDPATRSKARAFVRATVDAAGAFGAPAIIGSMQGRWGDDVSRETALGWLGEAVAELGEHARQYGTFLIYEPLNRYETNLVNTVADGVAFLTGAGAMNAKLLADLFHMNIEEVNVPDAIRAGAGAIGHVHFVDSTRRPAGSGHTDFAPITAALKDIGYSGYLSAEALPYPDSKAAARATIEAYRRLVR